MRDGTEFLFRKMKVLERDDVDGHTTFSVYLMPLTCNLKVV